MSESAAAANPVGRRVIALLMLTMLIDAMGFGLIAPVAPRLIMSLTDTDLSRAAAIGGWLMVVFAAMQFLFSPVLGNLSDRFGRRPVLLLSLAALSVDYLMMALAPSIAWLFAGRLIAGIASATYATANAVISDVIAANERARHFGLLGAAWGIGFILGPAIGGLLGAFGPRVPFYVAAALAAVNLMLGIVLLRETLAPENRRPFTLRRANIFGAIRQLRAYPAAFLLLGAIMFYQIAHDAMPSTWTYFTMLKFGWSEREVGLSLAALGLSVAIVQGGLIGPITRAIGERRAVYLGIACGIVGFVGYGLATRAWMLFVCVAIAAFFGLMMPSIRAIMSRQVPANAQGELNGAIGGVISLTAIFAPLLMTQLFRTFTAPQAPVHLPGAAFFGAALMLLLCAALFRLALRREQV